MFSWIFKHKKLYKPISSDFFSKSFNEQQSFIFIKSCKVKFFYILTFFFSRRQVPNNFLLLRAFFKLFNRELCSFFLFSLSSLSFFLILFVSFSFAWNKSNLKRLRGRTFVKSFSSHFQPYFKDGFQATYRKQFCSNSSNPFGWVLTWIRNSCYLLIILKRLRN